ncbi:MAG: tRNA (guanosine(46)-N7)-methyltransferase TrmB, partial [Alphaproteobacteria bacterium]
MTAPARKIFGRRKGKRLRARQEALLACLLPRIAPQGVTPADNPDRTPIELRALFGRDAPVWLEIGFGAGEHMLGLAARHPEIGLLGAESFVNGVASCLSHLQDAGLSNVRIHFGDA